MAIRIPILTSFDPKGLKQANAEFAKLQGSIGSLGRNFAVAGAAIAAAGAIIAKNAQSLARIETINAQTAQTIKSMGNASNISATQVETLAGSLESLTAVEAESIQEGANLLLTFGNIRNEMGAGNDIFTQTTKIMVDMGVALKKGPVATATMLGKALNDPIRGMTALTRVGVSFTDQQREQVKALQNSGDLMGAQRLILAELQNQYGGSGAAFAQTFTGQLELMGHELGTIGEEATRAVMPALQGMVTELRALIPVIGPQLEAAIESVDFVALGQAVVGFTSFLVNNAETILKVVAAVFALNTAYKLMAVVSGIASVALQVKTWWLAKAATGMTNAAIATGLFSGALKLIPFVAIVGGLGLIATGMIAVRDNARLASDETKKLYDDTRADLIANPWKQALNPTKVYVGILGDVRTEVDGIKTSLDKIPRQINTTVNIKENVFRDSREPGYMGVVPGPVSAPFAGSTPTPTAGGGKKTKTVSLAKTLKKEATLVKKQTKLIAAGVSAGLAARLTSTATPVKRANKALKNIAKNNGKLTKNLKKLEKNLAASIGPVVKSVSQSVEVIQDTSVADALDASVQREADALAERERVYSSFLDSVKSTFSNIKNAILGAFDLTQLGGSTNAITRNMDKLLVRLRSFATNVSKLSRMGLNPALLQQVISAGPMAGSRLAESLVMGGTGALAAINAGFNEFGTLSSQIATTGTNALFRTQAQQSVYNINVNGGVGSGATIGKAIVDAIKSYERTSGAVWQGA